MRTSSFTSLGPRSLTDYQPSKSPNALIGKSDLAVLGRVTSIEEGRVEGDPNEAPTHFVVVGLLASKVYKAPSRENTYYFEIPRPDNFTAAEYRERLPLGTSLVFIGATAKPMLPGGALWHLFFWRYRARIRVLQRHESWVAGRSLAQRVRGGCEAVTATRGSRLGYPSSPTLRAVHGAWGSLPVHLWSGTPTRPQTVVW
jgi:hypothetical protein